MDWAGRLNRCPFASGAASPISASTAIARPARRSNICSRCPRTLPCVWSSSSTDAATGYCAIAAIDRGGRDQPALRLPSGRAPGRRGAASEPAKARKARSQTRLLSGERGTCAPPQRLLSDAGNLREPVNRRSCRAVRGERRRGVVGGNAIDAPGRPARPPLRPRSGLCRDAAAGGYDVAPRAGGDLERRRGRQYGAGGQQSVRQCGDQHRAAGRRGSRPRSRRADPCRRKAGNADAGRAVHDAARCRDHGDPRRRPRGRRSRHRRRNLAHRRRRSGGAPNIRSL